MVDLLRTDHLLETMTLDNNLSRITPKTSTEMMILYNTPVTRTG
jgi:hypothetical protein